MFKRIKNFISKPIVNRRVKQIHKYFEWQIQNNGLIQNYINDALIYFKDDLSNFEMKVTKGSYFTTVTFIGDNNETITKFVIHDKYDYINEVQIFIKEYYNEIRLKCIMNNMDLAVDQLNETLFDLNKDIKNQYDNSNYKKFLGDYQELELVVMSPRDYVLTQSGLINGRLLIALKGVKDLHNSTIENVMPIKTIKLNHRGDMLDGETINLNNEILEFFKQ